MPNGILFSILFALIVYFLVWGH